ncbi:MAG: chemotaxis protein CheW [Bdellovibrionaceae bacterium]|nr:chemotaxis protein CheW [Pseudobdellovibrionaceae bacterium]
MGNDPFLDSLRKKGAETNIQFVEQAELLAQAVGSGPGDLRGLLVPIHTLKGDLGALGYVSGQQLVHEFESVVSELDDARELAKEKWKSAPASFFETVRFCLMDGLAVIRRYIDSVSEGQDEDPAACEKRKGEFDLCRGLLAEFSSLEAGEQPPSPSPSPSPAQSAPTTTTEQPRVMRTPAANIDLAAAAKHKDFFLLCSLNGIDYALPVSHVREVIKQRQIQDLPVARRDLIGLITLRGETLPVCNVTHLLATNAGTNHPLMVICQINDRKLAIPMERADKVLEIERSSFKPLQTSTAQESKGPIRHILQEKDGVILLVDVERLVAA